MPETPDFDQIAQRVSSSIPSVVTRELVQHDFAEQLRLVWNARGAVDLAMIEVLYEIATPTMKTLDGALRTLDR